DAEARRLERCQQPTEVRPTFEDHVVIADDDVRRLDVTEAMVATLRHAEAAERKMQVADLRGNWIEWLLRVVHDHNRNPRVEAPDTRQKPAKALRSLEGLDEDRCLARSEEHTSEL